MSRPILLLVVFLSTAFAAEARPVGFGQTAVVDGLRVRPLALLEDSRCPAQAVCVWAGRVRIKVRVTSRARSVTREMETGKPIQVLGGQLTLVTVTPDRDPSKPGPAAYRFTFSFTRGA
jgi:hypothetical protein